MLLRLPRASRLAIAALVFASPASKLVGAQVAVPDSARRVRDSLALDSLRARLARAEAAITLLREQLAAEAQSSAHTRSRIRVELSAQVLTNWFETLGRVNNVDVPQTVLAPPAPTATPPTNDILGVSLRQTRIGAAASVTDVLGGTFASDIDFDLFGGAQSGPADRRLFPEPRLRTARARLGWAHTDLMIGMETPLISDLNPVSLASVGTPGFSGAGNLWNWLGQVRVTREVATVGSGPSAVRLAVQGAVMSPFSSMQAVGEPDAADAGERSRRPSLEGRVRVRWGDETDEATIADAVIVKRGGEIGLGVHRGWLATAVGRLDVSRAVSLDGHAVVGPGMELRGEWYAGRLLRGLGGGGIAQNFGRAAPTDPVGALGPPIRDQAGWLQFNVQPHVTLLGGLGCGIDLVNDKDNPTRFQNTVCALHLQWRPMQPLVIGGEYRQLGTRYSTGTYGAKHVNLSFGVEM